MCFVLVCVHSFLLNVTWLNAILCPNCSFVHICLCPHFGWTNVCFFFSFLFCLISPISFYLFNLWRHLAWLWLSPPHDCCCCCCRHRGCIDVDAVHCPLSPCCTHGPPKHHGTHPLVFFFPPIFFSLLYFTFLFSILVSDSTRQSWESTMPPPVSKLLFFFLERERVKGSPQRL